MAYSPTTWETGDVITAAKLNNIESGLSQFQTDLDALDESKVSGSSSVHLFMSESGAVSVYSDQTQIQTLLFSWSDFTSQMPTITNAEIDAMFS